MIGRGRRHSGTEHARNLIAAVGANKRNLLRQRPPSGGPSSPQEHAERAAIGAGFSAMAGTPGVLVCRQDRKHGSRMASDGVVGAGMLLTLLCVS